MIKKLSSIDADFDRQLSDLLAMPDETPVMLRILSEK